LDKKIKKYKKSDFSKNKYKFKDVKSKQLGQYKPGSLSFSKKEINKMSSK